MFPLIIACAYSKSFPIFHVRESASYSSTKLDCDCSWVYDINISSRVTRSALRLMPKAEYLSDFDNRTEDISEIVVLDRATDKPVYEVRLDEIAES